MLLVQASDAAKLSGLTPHQLREWCMRRAILGADVPPNGPGRHALYSWRTVLALRVLNELHVCFGAEVGGWAPAIRSLRVILEPRSFHSLWSASALFRGREDEASILDAEHVGTDRGSVVVPLNPHLEILAHGLNLQSGVPQLQLFPATLVTGGRR